jgi:hypothetical protein
MNKISLKKVKKVTPTEAVTKFAESLDDDSGVLIDDVAKELGLSYSHTRSCAVELGVLVTIWDGGKKSIIVNPKVAKAWKK